jgi:hypothetical protein
MAQVRSHYQVLGVPRDAPREEIRRAHRRLVQVLHPDRHVETSSAERTLAERRMREINLAWHVLSDTGRRAVYDSDLSRDASGLTVRPDDGAAAGNGRPTGAHGFSPGTTGRVRTRPFGYADGASRSSSGAGVRASHVHGASRGGRDGLGPVASWLLHRGPILAVIGVSVGLVWLAAYAGSHTSSEVREVSGDEQCVLLLEGSSGRLIDCTLPNDGEVVAEAEAALDCPDGTRYALVESEFLCIAAPEE